MRIFFVLLAALLAATPGAAEALPDNVTIILENHSFAPGHLSVPAGRRIRVVLINRDTTAEEFDSVIRVNLRAPFLCMKYVLPGMYERRRGTVVTISKYEFRTCGRHSFEQVDGEGRHYFVA